MHFANEAQQACYRKIAPWLREAFGTRAIVREDAPAVMIRGDASLVHVLVLPWLDAQAIITCLTYVAFDIPATTELLQYLLQENFRLRLGAFALDDAGDLLVTHTLSAANCDGEAVRAIVLAIAGVADRYADTLIARWGGQRAMERRSAA